MVSRILPRFENEFCRCKSCTLEWRYALADKPKRKRKRVSNPMGGVKGTPATDDCPAISTRQTKLRRSARLSSKAANEKQPPSAPENTNAPTKQVAGFVFRATGLEPRVGSASGKLAQTQTVRRCEERNRRHFEPPVFSAGIAALNHDQHQANSQFTHSQSLRGFSVVNKLPPPPSISSDCPEMSAGNKQWRTEAGSLSSFQDRRDFAVPVYADENHYRPCSTVQPTVEKTHSQPFLLQPTSFAVQQQSTGPFNFSSSQHQPQQYGVLKPTRSEHPSDSFTRRVQSSGIEASSSNAEASSHFLSIPNDAVKLWNIARSVTDEGEDLRRCDETHGLAYLV
jgi:hypothetical protein